MSVHAVVGFGYPGGYRPVSWFVESSLIDTLGTEVKESRDLELREGSVRRLRVHRLGRHEMSATALLERVESPGEVHTFASSSLKDQTVRVDGEEKTVEERLDELLVEPLERAGFEVEVHWSSAFDPLSLLPELINTMVRLDGPVVLDLTHGVRIQPAISAVAGMAVTRLSELGKDGRSTELIPVYGATGGEVRGTFAWSDGGAPESRGVILDVRRHFRSAMAFNKIVDYAMDPCREHLEELRKMAGGAIRKPGVPRDRLDRALELVMGEGALKNVADALRSNYPSKVIRGVRMWDPEPPKSALDKVGVEEVERERTERYLGALSRFLRETVGDLFEDLDVSGSPWEVAMRLAEWECDLGYFAGSVLLLREVVYLRIVREWAEKHDHEELSEAVENYLRALVGLEGDPGKAYKRLCESIEEATGGEFRNPDGLVSEIVRGAFSR